VGLSCLSRCKGLGGRRRCSFLPAKAAAGPTSGVQPHTRRQSHSQGQGQNLSQKPMPYATTATATAMRTTQDAAQQELPPHAARTCVGDLARLFEQHGGDVVQLAIQGAAQGHEHLLRVCERACVRTCTCACACERVHECVCVCACVSVRTCMSVMAFFTVTLRSWSSAGTAARTNSWRQGLRTSGWWRTQRRLSLMASCWPCNASGCVYGMYACVCVSVCVCVCDYNC